MFAKKTANSEYTDNSANKNKAAWQIITKQLGNNSRHAVPSVNPEDFNKSLVDIIKKLSVNLSSSTDDITSQLKKCCKSPVNSFYIGEVTEFEVFSVIKGLKNL